MGVFDFIKKNELQEIARLKQELVRFQSIKDIESEIILKKKELEVVEKSELAKIGFIKKEMNDLKNNYATAHKTYQDLKSTLQIYENSLDLMEYGVYQPEYNFERSDQYRQEQALIIDKQKAMLQTDKAAFCNVDWTVGNSHVKGKAVVNRYKKLMLRAFNSECDALIAKVRWNNVFQMKERLQKSYETINNFGGGFNVYINVSYVELKTKELVLEHEYHLKKQQEKEQQRAMQEETREEEKARREYERAQKKAEDEEKVYQKALDKARAEMEIATGDKHDKLLQQITNLEIDLKAAQDRKERAMSMAQQTRRGFVYVISNVGSFGEGIYKIGLTRRLDPMDRVRELGDASVPFQFDVHAMIYSDDAPKLEAALHRAFDSKKVNMMNYRKEFFKVSLEEIETEIKSMKLKVDIVKLSEAMEYRETKAILQRQNDIENTLNEENEKFPESLF